MLDYVGADALAICDLAQGYGRTEALQRRRAEVGEGELVGLLGPNGAGKSTLVKIACGLVRPTSGTAQIAGAAAGRSRRSAALGYLAELFRFPDWLSADELLQLHQRLAGSAAAPPSARAAALVGLAEAPERRSARCQGHAAAARDRAGDDRLAAAAAARRADERARPRRPAHRPPAAGGAALRGVAVLLNSHLLSEVELVCDRVAIIARGEVVAAGAPAEPRAPAASRSRPAGGTRVYPEAGARTCRGSSRELVRPARTSTAWRAASSLEDAYLEAVGESR